MGPRHHGNYRRRKLFGDNLFLDLWDAFWSSPSVKCPKCGHDVVEYYDPFFFSPIRTLRGRRRVKCLTCHFIWRPKRSADSVWDKFMPRH